MKIEDPIFIVGTERSGSNLLRMILNEHEGISIPHPPHLIRDLGPLEGRYGNLAEDDRFRHLIDDAVRLVELHFAPWDITIDRDDIFRSATERSLYSVYAEIYGQYMRAQGKRRWGCKSTFMIHHVDTIRKFHQRPRMIHLVRDGRDVAASARDSVFNHFNPHYVAKLWSKQQKLAAEWAKRLPELFIQVRYEDLISYPEKEVSRICEFIGEKFSPTMLKFFENPGASKLASLSDSWKNLARPVLSSNSGKYRKRLSKKEIFEFERIASQELIRFGYALDNDAVELAQASLRPLDGLRYFVDEKANEARVQLRALIASDRNSFLRLRKKLYLLKMRLQ